MWMLSVRGLLRRGGQGGLLVLVQDSGKEWC